MEALLRFVFVGVLQLFSVVAMIAVLVAWNLLWLVFFCIPVLLLIDLAPRLVPLLNDHSGLWAIFSMVLVAVALKKVKFFAPFSEVHRLGNHLIMDAMKHVEAKFKAGELEREIEELNRAREEMRIKNAEARAEDRRKRDELMKS